MAGKLTVTRTFEISYSHTLIDHPGKCKQLHGHNGILEVEITGPKNEQGMIMDFGDLDKVVKQLVVDKLDHKHLNDIIIGNPTAENIVEWIVDKLYPSFKMKLTRVKLWETRDSFAEWRQV